jgi:hypothetical protein
MMKKLFLTFVVLLMVVVPVFGATYYVSNTDGDDSVGDGTTGNPWKTIGKAITSATAGDVIHIDADTYGEATVTVDKALTFIADEFNMLTTVTITNGITINSANAADVISLGETGESFNLGTTASALTLTKGVLNIASSKVVIGSGGKITRTNGSINQTPTVTNVNVDYGAPTVNLTAGPELPADLGTGKLTVALGATKSLTVPNALTAKGITITSGDVNFQADVTSTGNVTIADGDTDFGTNLTIIDATLENNGNDDVTAVNVEILLSAAKAATVKNTTGTLTISGVLDFEHDGGAAADYNTDISNTTGTLTISNPYTRTPEDNGGTDYYVTVDVENTTGTIVLTGGVGLDLVNNSAGGTIDLQGNFEFTGTAISNGNATAVIKVNSNTLTLSNAAATVTNAGKIISATAGTVGNGVLKVTGKTTVDAGEVPNVVIATGSELESAGAFDIYGTVDVQGTGIFDADHVINVKGAVTSAGTITTNAAVVFESNVTSSGTITIGTTAPTFKGNLTSTGAVNLNADVTVEGNYSQSTGGSLTWGGAQVFTIQGDWYRDSNVPGDVTPSTGTLAFTTAGDVTFTPGASLELYDVVINKASVSDDVTLAQSVVVNHDFTITTGTVQLSDYHIRMETAGGTFTNGSGGYNTGGIGYVIVDHAGATGFTGAGTFSNLDIRGGATVNLKSDINFSGTLNLRNGVLDLNDFNMTLTDVLVTVPQLNIWTTNGDLEDKSTTPTGAVAVGAGVEYDLTYYENTDDVNAEWLTAGIRNLNLAGNGTITQPAATTITGNLTISSGSTLNLNSADFTVSGDGAAHVVEGTLHDAAGGSELVVTGDAATLTGSSDDADARTIENMQVSIAAGESFTMSQIENLDNLVVDNGTVAVSLIDDPTANNDGQFTGNLTLTDGTLTFAIADESDGDDASAEEVAGNVTIVDGTLILGSDLKIGGTLDVGVGALDTGNIQLGSFDLTQAGIYTHNSAGGITGDGTLVMSYSGAANWILTEDLSVSNLEINTANKITITTGDLTVTNSYTHTAGELDIGAFTVEVTGDAVHYTAGTLSSTGSAGLFKLSGGDVALGLEGDFTIVDLELDVTSLTVSDQDGDATADADKVIITDDFTQTAGNIVLVDKIDFELQDDFTRIAGDWTMGTGSLILNGIGTIAQGTGFSVKNLEVVGSAATFANGKPWTITNLLTLAHQLDPGDDGAVTPGPQLTIADGVTIERSDDNGKLDNAGLTEDAIYAGNINLAYTTDGGGITTSGEVPTDATVLNDMTVEVPLTLAKDVTVNGTLKVVNTTVDIQTTNAKDLNMANGATAHLVKYAAAMFDEALKPAGTLNVIFEQFGGAVTSDDDVLDPAFTIGTLTVDGATAADELNLHDNITVNTLSVIDDAPLDPAGKNITVTNADLDFVGNTGTVTPSTASALTFGGTGGTFSIGQDWVVDGNLSIVINTNNIDDQVTLSGGDLDFATAPVDLVLTKGVLVTGTNEIVLKQSRDGNNIPTQGFTRTSGVVYGNVKKLISNVATDAADIANVQFPVGTPDGKYRPAITYFKNTPQSSFNMVVSHENTSPGGENGLPLTVGDQTVTNYPDFYWVITSTPSLAPSYQWDIELQAENYPEYSEDGIQNIRMIRRTDGALDNPWVLQGEDAKYDNYTYAANWPAIKVIDSEGGLTDAGNIFTYSQSNKAPTFTAAMTDVTIAEGDSSGFTYTATDVDIGQTATLSAVTLPVFATFDAATGVLSYEPGFDDAGPHTVTIRATDGTDNTDSTVTITVTDVNRDPEWVVAPADTVEVGEGTDYYLELSASDDDADNTGFTYTVVTTTSDSVEIVNSDSLHIDPDFGEAGNYYDVTLRVEDSAGGQADTSFVFAITDVNRSPVWAVAMEDTTVDENATLTLDFGPNVSDPDGDALTFTCVMLEGISDSGAIVAATGVYTWTPDFTQAGTYELIVTASDGTASANDTVMVVVNDKNSPPQFTVTLSEETVAEAEAWSYKYVANDLDGDELSFEILPAYQIDGMSKSVVEDSCTLSWTPDFEDAGAYTIKLRVTDGVASDTTTGTLIVLNTEQDPPYFTVMMEDTSFIRGDSLGFQYVAIDPNSIDTPIYALVEGPEGATIDDTTGLFVWNPTTEGIHRIIVSVTDGYNDAVMDTASVTGLLWGDANMDFQALAPYFSSDAALVLRHSVELDTLTGDALYVADVSDDDMVNAYDASFILRYSVGIITEFPAESESMAKEVIASGNVSWKLENVSNTPDKLRLPIELSNNPENVYSIEVRTTLDPTTVELSDVTSTLPRGWQLAYRNDGGNVIIAMAGTEPLRASRIAVLELSILNKESSATITGTAQINAMYSEQLESVSLRQIPSKFALNQNYPNPFNPTTTIAYQLAEDSKVTIQIYDLLGNKVRTLVNSEKASGYYKAQWNGLNDSGNVMPSGAYIYRITAGSFQKTKKMLLMK